MSKIRVNGTEITILNYNENDYICFNGYGFEYRRWK